jgi:GNAT superfamily N-acetyltransferase
MLRGQPPLIRDVRLHMGATVTFGVATLDDLPRVIEMKLAMFADSGRSGLLAPGIEKAIRDDYADLYAKDLATHFVARTKERLVASVGAFIKSDLPFRYFDPPHYGFIGDVFTERNFRGQGLATSLNRQAIEWLRAKGVTMVRLLASEVGRPLYEKLGFRPSDEMVLTYAI